MGVLAADTGRISVHFIWLYINRTEYRSQEYLAVLLLVLDTEYNIILILLYAGLSVLFGKS